MEKAKEMNKWALTESQDIMGYKELQWVLKEIMIKWAM